MFGISAGAALVLGAGGAMALSSMGGSDQPDTSGMNAAAVQQANLSKEQLDWAKQVYAETAPDRADATRRANAVSDAQLESMNTQTGLAKDYDAYNKSTFRPLEQGIVADAQSYDTTARRESEAAKATAGVEMGLSNARNASNRDLERSGVAPGSAKQLALSGAMDLGSAKLKAGAANAARTQVETLGQARRMDAANLGRGLASNQATSAGLALTAGNSAAANGLASGNINAQGNQIMTSGFSGAQSGLAGAAGTYGRIAGIDQQAGDNSGLWQAAGTVAGAYFGGPAGAAAGGKIGSSIGSDKNIKTGRQRIDSKVSLAAVRKIPVDSWKYKNGSSEDDGGKTHIGPMAQDVRQSLGDVTAPNGKRIDLISMSGHQTGAIQELDKRVIKLENARKPTVKAKARA